YAAVAVARALFRKGAHFANAIIFEFASTNLVFELGLVLLVLLGWQFLTAELAGRLLVVAIPGVGFKYTLRPGRGGEAGRAGREGAAGPDGGPQRDGHGGDRGTLSAPAVLRPGLHRHRALLLHGPGQPVAGPAARLPDRRRAGRLGAGALLAGVLPHRQP